MYATIQTFASAALSRFLGLRPVLIFASMVAGRSDTIERLDDSRSAPLAQPYLLGSKSTERRLRSSRASLA